MLVRLELPILAPNPGLGNVARRPLASAAQDDQLLLEQEILRDHRSHATESAVSFTSRSEPREPGVPHPTRIG